MTTIKQDLVDSFKDYIYRMECQRSFFKQRKDFDNVAAMNRDITIIEHCLSKIMEYKPAAEQVWDDHQARKQINCTVMNGRVWYWPAKRPRNRKHKVK